MRHLKWLAWHTAVHARHAWFWFNREIRYGWRRHYEAPTESVSDAIKREAAETPSAATVKSRYGVGMSTSAVHGLEQILRRNDPEAVVTCEYDLITLDYVFTATLSDGLMRSARLSRYQIDRDGYRAIRHLDWQDAGRVAA